MRSLRTIGKIVTNITLIKELSKVYAIDKNFRSNIKMSTIKFPGHFVIQISPQSVNQTSKPNNCNNTHFFALLRYCIVTGVSNNTQIHHLIPILKNHKTPLYHDALHVLTITQAIQCQYRQCKFIKLCLT